MRDHQIKIKTEAGSRGNKKAETVTLTKLLAAALCVGVAVPAPVFAAGAGDFHYEEKTQITGGSLVGMMKMAGAFSKQARRATDPVLSSVYVQGNRMARINPLTSEIIDLDKETITNIDHTKKTYTTVTFEQMREQMEAAMRKAKEEQAKRSAEPAAEPTPQANNTEMNFDVKVRNTDATKEVAGLATKEAIMAMTLEGRDKSSGQKGAMAMTNDMWMAPEIPGYAEVRDFEVRFAQKMKVVMGGAMSPQVLAMQPGMGEGMAKMVTEVSKLKGVPLMQVMRVGMTVNGAPLPAASEAPLPPTPDVALPSGSEIAGSVADNAANSAQQSAVNKVASKMGGFGGVATGLPSFGGFGHKKKAQPKAEEPPPEPAAQSGAANPNAAQSSVLMESTTEITSFSQGAVDGSKFEVPAGYQQVVARSDMSK